MDLEVLLALAEQGHPGAIQALQELALQQGVQTPPLSAPAPYVATSTSPLTEAVARGKSVSNMGTDSITSDARTGISASSSKSHSLSKSSVPEQKPPVRRFSPESIYGKDSKDFNRGLLPRASGKAVRPVGSSRIY